MSNELQTAANQLRGFLDRIERLEEERKALADDIGDIYAELAATGFDKAAAKVVLRIRRDSDGLEKWTERSATVDMYLSALGMIAAKEEPRAPAPARARENIEEIPSRGHLRMVESQPVPAESKGEEISAPIPEHVPDFLRSPAPTMRPHCLNRENCGGVGFKHCHTCTKAAGISPEAA